MHVQRLNQPGPMTRQMPDGERRLITFAELEAVKDRNRADDGAAGLPPPQQDQKSLYNIPDRQARVSVVNGLLRDVGEAAFQPRRQTTRQSCPRTPS